MAKKKRASGNSGSMRSTKTPFFPKIDPKEALRQIVEQINPAMSDLEFERRYASIESRIGTAASPQALQQLIVDNFFDGMGEDEEISGFCVSQVLREIDALGSEELALWRRLLALAQQFWEKQPWRQLYEDQVFAIKIPGASGTTDVPTSSVMSGPRGKQKEPKGSGHSCEAETWYCSIMGNGGQHFALAAYQGDAACDQFLRLKSQLEMGEGDVEDPDSAFSFLVRQKGIQMVFEPEHNLMESDRHLYDKLNFTPSKNLKGYWPHFQDYTPGYFPWPISMHQVRVFTTILEQTLQFLPRLKQLYDSLKGSIGGGDVDMIDEIAEMGDTFPAQIGVVKNNRTIWSEGWATLSAEFEPVLIVRQKGIPDAATVRSIEEIAISSLSRKGNLQFGFDFIREPCQNGDERPFFPIVGVIYDKKADQVVWHHLGHQPYFSNTFYRELLDWFQKQTTWPKEIQAWHEAELEVLEPIMSRLGIKIKQISSSPKLDAILDQICSGEFADPNAGEWQIEPGLSLQEQQGSYEKKSQTHSSKDRSIKISSSKTDSRKTGSSKTGLSKDQKLTQKGANKQYPDQNKRKNKPARGDGSPVIFQLKITLDTIKPPIWRRILIPAHYTFEQLHDAIQEFMGWDDDHLHVFSVQVRTPYPQCIRIAGKTPGSDEYDPSSLEYAQYKEDCVALSDFFSEDSPTVRYTYDFGDNWDHTIKLEKIVPINLDIKYPHLIKAKGECPPEDCGGPWGFMEMRDELDDEDEFSENDGA